MVLSVPKREGEQRELVSVNQKKENKKDEKEGLQKKEIKED